MSSSSTSFRPPGQHTAPPTARQQAAYSSLGEALGTERPGLPSYSQQPPPSSSSSLPMPSDGRYMYQHQQGMTSYDYSSYPHNSYDASQFPQTHPRQPRSSQSHPPPSDHVPYNPPQPHYHPSYGSAPYAVPHPAPPQWNGEGWPQFSQPVAPPASVPETPVPPPPSRPEPPAAPAPAPAPAATPATAPPPAPPSQRGYATTSPQPQPANTEMRRTAGTPKSADPPSQAKRKPREKEAAAPRHSSPLASAPLASTTPLDIDFGKLVESYRIIIDTTNALSNDPAAVQGRPPSLEALQRISQSAALGLRLLGSTASNESPGAVPPTEAPVATPGNTEEGDAAAKRQKAEAAPVPEGQTCLGCNATSTPEWRRGPLGPRTLCNACGLVYAKLIKKRKRDAARRAANAEDANDGTAADDAGYPSSGDEDESASQEFRMEDEQGGRG